MTRNDHDESSPKDQVHALQAALEGQDYLADNALATAIHLGRVLGKPLFLEGEPGVGKTEVAKVLARHLDLPLIRLQCYEGLDVSQALYEWNYSAQLLEIRSAEAEGRPAAPLFDRRFLLPRPLLEAIDPDERNGKAVLLIDEIDRTDDEFEAFLLELLSDFQVTIPELGTLGAEQPPTVILTSNRTREVHDALKRRCIYHWIDFPSFEKELAIVRRRVPEVEERLAGQLVRLVQALREEDLFKKPGVAETLDWVQALVSLDLRKLDESTLRDTLGTLLKYRDDLEVIDEAAVQRLFDAAGTA